MGCVSLCVTDNSSKCFCHLNYIPSPGYAINHWPFFFEFVVNTFVLTTWLLGISLGCSLRCGITESKGNKTRSLRTELKGSLHSSPWCDIRRWLSLAVELQARPANTQIRVLKLAGTLKITSAHTLFVVFQIRKLSRKDLPELARPSGSRLGLFLEIKLHHGTENGMARRPAAQLEMRLCSSGAWEPERAPPSPSADYT